MEIYFLPLVIATGIMTMISDISKKKINNRHIVLILSAALFLYLYFIFTGKFRFSWLFLINMMVSLIVIFALYYSGLWKGGDGKLFFTYSFIIPFNNLSAIISFPCLTLFCYIFTIGLLFIIPSYIYSFMCKKINFFKEFISKNELLAICCVFVTTFSINIVISLLLRMIHAHFNGYLFFILLYICQFIVMKYIDEDKYKRTIPVFLSFVLFDVLVFIFNRNVFYFDIFISKFKYLLFYILVFHTVNKLIVKNKELGEERIPFAPFMFVGALLCYTNLLSLILGWMNYLR